MRIVWPYISSNSAKTNSSANEFHGNCHLSDPVDRLPQSPYETVANQVDALKLYGGRATSPIESSCSRIWINAVNRTPWAREKLSADTTSRTSRSATSSSII